MGKQTNTVKFGVPGFFGCSNVLGCFRVFRGVPGCSGLPGFSTCSEKLLVRVHVMEQW